MWLLIAFMAVPLIEIALFIQVGGAIGLWPTLLIVVLTAILGSTLVRSQGTRELANLRQSFSSLQDPTRSLAHGAMILFAGALLLTPGFFTDLVGFSLLVPAVRVRLFDWLGSRVKVERFTMGPGPETRRPHPGGPRDQVIDGEFEEVRQPRRPSDKPSGWTQGD